jgi:hypothetical protein
MRLEKAMRRDADGQDCRLRVLGQQKVAFRAVEAQPAETLTERLVCFRECVATDLKRIG